MQEHPDIKRALADDRQRTLLADVTQARAAVAASVPARHPRSWRPTVLSGGRSWSSGELRKAA